jgi:hypothetical protein
MLPCDARKGTTAQAARTESPRLAQRSRRPQLTTPPARLPAAVRFLRPRPTGPRTPARNSLAGPCRRRHGLRSLARPQRRVAPGLAAAEPLRGAQRRGPGGRGARAAGPGSAGAGGLRRPERRRHGQPLTPHGPHRRGDRVRVGRVLGVGCTPAEAACQRQPCARAPERPRVSPRQPPLSQLPGAWPHPPHLWTCAALPPPQPPL